MNNSELVMSLPVTNNTDSFERFVLELKQRIRQAQHCALQIVNKELIALYWSIGQQIVQSQMLYGWGKSVVAVLSEELQKEFVGAKGFSAQNLWNMRMYYLAYQEQPKLQTLSREISWSHNVKVVQKLKDPLAQQFYIQATLKNGWSVHIFDHLSFTFCKQVTIIGMLLLCM